MITWSKPSDPSVYGQYEFDVTAAKNFIEAYNTKHNCKITLTHYVAKAIGITIAKHPQVNGIIKWGHIYQRDTVDVFLQVAIDKSERHHTEHLSGALIREIDKLSLGEISGRLKSLASNIREDNDPQFQKTFNVARLIPQLLLRPLVRLHEFLVFNLGLHWPSLGLFRDPFGSVMLTSVGPLNAPPGFAPLVPASRCPFLICLGRVENKPWVVGDSVVVRPVAGFTVTFDHRFVDGLVASRMFQTFLDILYHPEQHLG